jgi:hypothetical protein
MHAPFAVEAVPSNEELERCHALIGKVVIDNENIFDLTDPRENNWLFRLANRVHIRYRGEGRCGRSEGR